jgi:hypothetical protein
VQYGTCAGAFYVFKNLIVEARMCGSRQKEESFPVHLSGKYCWLFCQTVVLRDTQAECLSTYRLSPKVLMLDRLHAESDMQLSSQHAINEFNGGSTFLDGLPP